MITQLRTTPGIFPSFFPYRKEPYAIILHVWILNCQKILNNLRAHCSVLTKFSKHSQISGLIYSHWSLGRGDRLPTISIMGKNITWTQPSIRPTKLGKSNKWICRKPNLVFPFLTKQWCCRHSPWHTKEEGVSPGWTRAVMNTTFCSAPGRRFAAAEWQVAEGKRETKDP